MLLLLGAGTGEGEPPEPVNIPHRTMVGIGPVLAIALAVMNLG
jgi:hypothetical protein